MPTRQLFSTRVGRSFYFCHWEEACFTGREAKIKEKGGKKGKKMAGFLYHLPWTGFHSTYKKRWYKAEGYERSCDSSQPVKRTLWIPHAQRKLRWIPATVSGMEKLRSHSLCFCAEPAELLGFWVLGASCQTSLTLDLSDLGICWGVGKAIEMSKQTGPKKKS